MQRFFIFISIFLLLPFQSAHAQSSNAGIVQGLWYSQDKVFAGEKVRIYVAIRNNTGGDLKGIVEFFDGEKKLERQNVQALSGRIIESWTDWTPTYGSHSLKATIIRTELSQVGSSTKEIVVSSALAEDTLFVDYDTDKDGIGNTEDINDDNDTYTDAEEKQNGTDPLVKNEVKVQKETSDDKEEVRDVAETDDEDDKRVATQNSSEGLEQYLAPSRAETVLSSVTKYVDTAKQKVDNYRQERAEVKDAETVTVNEDGFGAITRTEAGEKKSDVPQKEDGGGGFLDKASATLSSLLSNVYAFILWLVSFVLGHPMLVQLAILLGILFTIIRFASKFGKRKNRF